jgi:hypothetical protein
MREQACNGVRTNLAKVTMLKPIFLLGTVALLSACDINIAHRLQTGEPVHETKVIENDKFEMARIDIKMGVGELKVEGGSPKLLEADFVYNVPGWKPIVESHSASFRADIKIAQPEGISAPGNTDYKWNLRLSDNLPLNIITHLGAGRAEMNLGSMDLQNVEVHMGVGELKLDLRGQPKRDYNVDIRGGVGEATVYLPSSDSTGVVATASGGIGDIHVEGLEHQGGRWVSRSYDRAPIRVRVDVKGGVGDIKLIAQ